MTLFNHGTLRNESTKDPFLKVFLASFRQVFIDTMQKK